MAHAEHARAMHTRIKRCMCHGISLYYPCWKNLVMLDPILALNQFWNLGWFGSWFAKAHTFPQISTLQFGVLSSRIGHPIQELQI